MSDDREPPVHDDRPVTALDGPGDPAAPTIADGLEHRLDPNAVNADRLARGIAASVIAGLSFIGVLALMLAGVLGGASLLLLPAWMVLNGTFAGLLVWWPSVSYRYTSYRVSGQAIRIRRGVLWRSVSTVPRSRVQHTDVSQGPVERLFNLATLIIYTAGTEYASVHLGGLAHETALRIRDHLIEGGEDDAV